MKHPLALVIWSALLWSAGFQPVHAATGLDPAAPSPMFRHDAQHTGRSPYVGPATATVKWTFPVGALAASSPVIDAHGTVYMSGEASMLFAINPDGTMKWLFETDGFLLGEPPAVDVNGTVYICSSRSTLYAVNPDGTQK
jgi:outer membrane protein assembly factor BamB